MVFMINSLAALSVITLSIRRTTLNGGKTGSNMDCRVCHRRTPLEGATYCNLECAQEGKLLNDFYNLLDEYPVIFNKDFRFWHRRVVKGIGYEAFMKLFDSVMVLDIPDHIAGRKLGSKLKQALAEKK